MTTEPAYAHADARAEHSNGWEARAAEGAAASARAAGPLRRVLAALAARLLDAPGVKNEKGWERLGYARLADYARERVGVSARTLQELARVGQRLDSLPRLEASLVSGELPWSKVRLLARFVTPQNEADWIGVARGVRVRALERSVRAVARGSLEAGPLSADPAPETDEEGMEREACERFGIRGPPSLCFKWQRAQEYASRMAGAQLPGGALLEIVTAEVLSALPLDSDGEGEAPESGSRCDARADTAEPKPSEVARAASVCASQDGPAHSARPLAGPAELPAFLRPLLAGLAEADAFEVDARIRRAIRLEQRLDADIARSLREVTAVSSAWRIHSPTLAAFAREQLGMSPRKARALLRLERAGDACPALRHAFREGRLSWVQAQLLVPLVAIGPQGDESGSWREAWLGFAARVSVRGLEDAVADALTVRDGDPQAWQRSCDRPERFGIGGSARTGRRQTCARPTDSLGTVRIQLRAPRDVARLFRAVLCSVRTAVERETGRLPSESEGFEAMIDHALLSWGVDDAWLKRRSRVRHRVFERDGWRCTVPGCSARRNLHAHHIEFRSRGGSDALDNQTTLCAVHHQRGVHAGRVRIVGKAPFGLVYELGLRPGLPPLERYRSGDRTIRSGEVQQVSL